LNESNVAGVRAFVHIRTDGGVMTLSDALTQDIRFAMRQLVRSRSFAATVIVTSLASGGGVRSA
jgi:hypothetical protein